MQENQLILEIAKLLSGSPSVWVSIVSLEKKLENVIEEQRKLYEKICVAK